MTISTKDETERKDYYVGIDDDGFFIYGTAATELNECLEKCEAASDRAAQEYLEDSELPESCQDDAITELAENDFRYRVIKANQTQYDEYK